MSDSTEVAYLRAIFISQSGLMAALGQISALLDFQMKHAAMRQASEDAKEGGGTDPQFMDALRECDERLNHFRDVINLSGEMVMDLVDDDENFDFRDFLKKGTQKPE